MTREEAADILEEILRLNPRLGQKDHPAIEAMKVALTALRPVSKEQVERMRGEWIKPHWKNSTSCAVCSQCGFEAHHHEYHGVQDTYLFCPRCMAPMTDEAVEMVMERMEELKDGKEYVPRHLL